jgi:hypothetical protein
MQTLTLWALSLMLYLQPVSRHRSTLETVPQRDARYQEIAAAIEKVVAANPPLIPGPSGRAYTAAVLLSVTYIESGWRKDVDLGLSRAKRASWGEEDHGRSWCMGQINLGSGTVPVGDDVMKSWTGKDLISDREKCMAVVLEMVRRSFASCRLLPRDHWLNQYASGECKPDPAKCDEDKVCLDKQARKYADASHKSRVRVQLANRVFHRFAETAPKEGTTAGTP